MKTSFLLLLILFCSTAFDSDPIEVKDEIQGAWESGTDEMRITRTYAGEYFSVAIYNHSGKEFISTSGGKFEIKDG